MPDESRFRAVDSPTASPSTVMFFLAIETSCDETAAAVFTDEPAVLSNVVASQTDLHARFGGVVPEVAARAHLQRLLPVIDEALRQAGVRLDQIGCVAVHNTPGLVGALLVGVSAAKMLALALERAADRRQPRRGPHLRLPAGRGARHLPVRRPGRQRRAHDPVPLPLRPASSSCSGATLDDAAGEAFDKVASLLGLGFPGGPAVEREAAGGNPRRFRFPRSFLHEDRLDFSFSGLKTAVLYTVHGQDAVAGGRRRRRAEPGRPGGQLSAGGDRRAGGEGAAGPAAGPGCKRLAVGGGVAANRALARRPGAHGGGGMGRAVHPAAAALHRQRRHGGRWPSRNGGGSNGRRADLDAVPTLTVRPCTPGRHLEFFWRELVFPSIHVRFGPSSNCAQSARRASPNLDGDRKSSGRDGLRDPGASGV